MSDDGFLRATLGASDLVYNIARRAVPQREDAEDLVQDTFLAAYRAWMQRRRPRKVEPWLATICLNLARSRHRSLTRRVHEVSWEELDSLAGDDRPDDEAIAAVDRELVHRALWRLSEEHRLAISLVDLAGFSTAEAARILDVPRGTVLSRLHRGRKSLAVILRGAGQDVPEREEADP